MNGPAPLRPPWHRAPAWRLSQDTALQVVLTVLGTLLLFGFVWFGAILQPGEAQCAICSGGVCTGSTTDCPGTYADVVTVLLLLAGAAATLAVGLSPSVLDFFTPDGYDYLRARGVSGSRLSMEFLAPFLTFYGWGITAWGWMLPLDIFAFCAEPCVYPYVLQGIPLTLVWVGSTILGAGVALLATLAVLRRDERMRSTPTAPPTPPRA